MERSVRLEAPAKVNFGLRVTGVRPDGFHEIESLFLPLALADCVEVAHVGEGVSLEVQGVSDGVPAGSGNLAVRAARSFFAAAGSPGGAAIRLCKRVPVAGGLGGGSSDAAAVLRALAALHPGRLSPARLAEIALGLGADVPYFLDPRPAWVSGIGERIEPAPDLPSLVLLLLNPGTPLATAEVYAAFDASLTPEGTDPRIAGRPGPGGGAMEPRSERSGRLRALARGEPGPGGGLRNDLEAAAHALCPAAGKLQQELWRRGALAVGLSGSGPSVFGVFRTEEEAEAARRALDLRAPAGAWVTRTGASPPAREGIARRAG